jgi:UDP-N-acetylglucosamine--N-acetylmuramyl-(pentapeptide) pyrophosphoryl-undecaprenol N-acetylglucosamine transferase
MPNPSPKVSVAIACGGTGGHLFPGRAVAEELVTRGCGVTLLISPKDVDQQAARTAAGMHVVTLPAVGLSGWRLAGFLRGAYRSYRLCARLFQERPHQAVLAMGGFTSAPAVLAGKRAAAATFLHESNAMAGRSNRWLARVVDQAFVGFPQACRWLPARSIEVTGTPVRSQFQPGDAPAARLGLGLDPRRPLLLVMGGSQGAGGLNELLLRSMVSLGKSLPALQFLHLTGPNDGQKVSEAYRAAGLRAVTRPFLTEMELAMAAATLAVSRAGASSMAELAAMRLPAIFVPYPFAADNHQEQNARVFVEAGAALMLRQQEATPELFVRMVTDLVGHEERIAAMQNALARWYQPDVAARLADRILEKVLQGRPGLRLAPAESRPNFPRQPDDQGPLQSARLPLKLGPVPGTLAPCAAGEGRCKLKS